MRNRRLPAAGCRFPVTRILSGPRSERDGAGRSGPVLIVMLAAGIVAAACGHGSGVTAAAAQPKGHAPSGPAPTGYAPWPEAEHDATHSSEAAVRGPQTGHIRWKANLGSAVSPGPSVGADGTIYESANAGVLYALNPVNGHQLWKFDGGGSLGVDDLSTTAAVLPDGTIVWPGPGTWSSGWTPRARSNGPSTWAGSRCHR